MYHRQSQSAKNMLPLLPFLISWMEICCHSAESLNSFESTIDTCGVSPKRMPKILGGERSESDDWPWMAALGYVNLSGDFKLLCGGSLISDRYVITAAHCFIEKLKIVRLGSVHLNNDVLNKSIVPVDVGIEKAIAHPKYKDKSRFNDIGVIRLQHSVRFNRYILPICLPKGEKYKSNEFYDRKKAYVAGWGQTKLNTRTAALMDTLAPLSSNGKCKLSLLLFKLVEGILDDTLLCSDLKKKGICPGDSGNPLMIAEKRQEKPIFTLAGITTLGMSCIRETEWKSSEGIFIKVAAYVEWVDNVTQNYTWSTTR